MSIDTLGLQAAEVLRDATADVDVERSLNLALTPRAVTRRWTTVLVVAAVVTVLVLGWVGSRLVTDEQSAPPLDLAPREVVGDGLSVPVRLTVPEGWVVKRDARAVVLSPLDGSSSSMTLLGQPVMVYQPPDFRLRPLREDLVVWTTTHPDLQVRDQFGLDGPGFAWSGTEMELALADGASNVPLVPVPGRPSLAPLEITTSDRTFLWDVIYLTDSPPLLVASQSPIADDAALKSARDELLQSLQASPPPN